MGEQWRALVRRARRRLKMNLQELAERSGLSYETVRGYENGRRRPRREHLVAVMRTLQTPQIELNDALRDAGFAPEETLFPEDRFPSYFFRLDELDDAVERVPWPEFAVTDSVEVVAANVAAQALWDMDFGHERRVRTRAQLNMLTAGSDRRIADRVVNWDECVGLLLSVAKGNVHGAESLDTPSPYMTEVLAEFAKGDPAFVPRLIDLWNRTAPLPPKIRQQYRVVWRDHEFGEMRFIGLITSASERDGFAFNDWHPMDAETWITLAKVKRRWCERYGRGEGAAAGGR